jgi:hypothetical protein
MEPELFRKQGLIPIVVSQFTCQHDTNTVWVSNPFGRSGYDGRNWDNCLTKDGILTSE